VFSSTNYFDQFFGGSQSKIDSSSLSLADIEMPTRIIYKRRNEKEKRLAKLLLIATVVLAIGGAGIAACFTAIGHVDAVLRSELPEFSWKRW
jgi:molybdopterin biosynthesis enzyme MoaB